MPAIMGLSKNFPMDLFRELRCSEMYDPPVFYKNSERKITTQLSKTTSLFLKLVEPANDNEPTSLELHFLQGHEFPKDEPSRERAVVIIDQCGNEKPRLTVSYTLMKRVTRSDTRTAIDQIVCEARKISETEAA